MRAISRGSVVALWAATVVAAFAIGWITPPPLGPPAPDDMVASLRSALGEGDLIERQGRIASLLERLDPFDVPAVAAFYERMTPLIDASELAAFFAAWARFDPLGAVEHAASWRLIGKRKQREIGLRAAIGVWAQRDPSAARRAVEDIGTDIPAVREVLRHGLVTGWAHSPRGQEGLADFIADLAPLQPRVKLIETAARELVRGGGAEAALGWAEPVLRDEGYKPAMKLSVFRAVADAAAQEDPERTAAWVLEQSGYAAEGVGIVAEHWGRLDGEAAMAWLAEQPAGELRDEATGEAFGQWWSADWRRAAAWLDTEQPAALRDPALESKAKRLADRAPERALGFCERIEDSTRRQSCLELAAKRWYAKEAVAAETWLQQSSLDEAARSRVRTLTDPEQQQSRRPRRPRAGGPPR